MHQIHPTTADLTQAGLNLIQQALSIYDAELKLVVCNSRFQEMFSLPSALVSLGADFGETIRFLAERGDYGPIDDLPGFVQEKIDQALAFEPHYVERERANGTMISVEGTPLRQGGWVTVYTDITSIKRQEQLLRSHSEHLSDQLLTYSEELAESNRKLAATISTLEETKRSLIESEARTRMTTEMTPAHIAHLDLGERYTYSNKQLGKVITARPGRIEGLSARAALGDEAYTAIKPYLEKAFQGQASVFEFTHSDGPRRIRCAFTPDTDFMGEINGAYVLSMDVTEEAQARAALMQTRKRELAAQLTSGLAHDFSNLLTIILGLQGQLERMADLPKQAQEAVTTTKAAALRGGALLDRLSGISGPRELTLKAADIQETLAGIKALAQPSLPRSVELQCRVESIDRPVICDSGFMQDSILNLVLNARDAIKGTPDSEDCGKISVLARPLGASWLEISVTDTGTGFSQEALQHALDPFFTTKAAHEGTGLGLSMVYDFAQLSGGQLRISNTPRGGASVILRLPLKYAAINSAPRLVLLVEDTVEIRDSVREMLRDLGHSVLEATTAEEALDLSRLPGIDTVLTDIMLDGEMTGLELAKTLRAQAIPAQIVMMTGLAKTDALHQEAAHAFPLLGKPFSADQLAHFLEKDQPT